MSDRHDARLIREVAIRYVGARRRCPDAIREPTNVAAYLRRRIHDNAREPFVATHVDGRHRPVADCVVSIGTATASLVHPCEVFQPAIAVGAGALLIGHNHPSGDPTLTCSPQTDPASVRGSRNDRSSLPSCPRSPAREDGEATIAALDRKKKPRFRYVNAN